MQLTSFRLEFSLALDLKIWEFSLKIVCTTVSLNKDGEIIRCKKKWLHVSLLRRPIFTCKGSCE